MIFNRELLEQISFGMENQESEFFLNLESMKLVNSTDAKGTDLEDRESLVPLPSWQPLDGYHLMKRSVSEPHNPLVREEWHKSFHAGDKVLRDFEEHIEAVQGS